MLRDLIISPLTIKGEYIENGLHQTPIFELKISNSSFSKKMQSPIVFEKKMPLYFRNALAFCRNTSTQCV